MPLLVGDELAVHQVRQSPFQAPQRFLGGLALGALALVILAARRAGVADLGDGIAGPGVVSTAGTTVSLRIGALVLPVDAVAGDRRSSREELTS